MGSFNTTCFASQQTIIPGEPCIILPIAQSTTYNPVEMVLNDKPHSQYGISHSTCYPTAFWNYASPIIKGKYNDYGKFELDHSEENESNIVSFFNYLHKSLLEIKRGKNEYHELALNFKKLFNPKQKYSFEKLEEIWENVWSVGQENRLFVLDFINSIPVPFQFAVMHQETAKYLINVTNKQKTWDGKTREQKEYFANYSQSMFEKIKKVFAGKKDIKEVLNFFSMQISSLDGFRIGESEGTHISLHYNNFEKVMNIFDKYFKDNETNIDILPKEFINELFKVFKNEIDHRYIHGGLDSLNIKLSPMVYAGQDYQNEIGNDYAKMVNAVNKAINLEIKEKNDEFDDAEIVPLVVTPRPKTKM